MGDEKPKKKKKTIAEKYPTRQALVYGGAALLIVIVGMRTLLTVAGEGEFGLMEFITIGGLGLEFSMLLLYAWTIYGAGKESQQMAAEEEAKAEEEEEAPELDINVEDLPELAAQIGQFAAKSGDLVSQLIANQDAVIKHSQELNKFNQNLTQLLDEQVKLKVHQEIQRILSSAAGESK